MIKANYQKKLDAILAQMTPGAADKPLLLLHACCAPCSSYVLEYLTAYFDLHLFFYNPNIAPEAEYSRRREELLRFVEEAPHTGRVTVEEGPFEPDAFAIRVRGVEAEPEGGLRCARCFRMRLEKAAQRARALHADAFTTTLTLSPHKNAALLNDLGAQLGERYGVPFLPSDFKKKGGFMRSLELSAAYGLYRQDYCGCRFSWRKESTQ